jgi:hypothetical protein
MKDWYSIQWRKESDIIFILLKTVTDIIQDEDYVSDCLQQDEDCVSDCLQQDEDYVSDCLQQDEDYVRYFSPLYRIPVFHTFVFTF